MEGRQVRVPRPEVEVQAQMRMEDAQWPLFLVVHSVTTYHT